MEQMAFVSDHLSHRLGFEEIHQTNLALINRIFWVKFHHIIADLLVVPLYVGQPSVGGVPLPLLFHFWRFGSPQVVDQDHHPVKRDEMEHKSRIQDNEG